MKFKENSLLLDLSLFNDAWNWSVPLLVGLTSLTGSIHCAGMCGPLITSLVHTRTGRISYHLGRGLSYTTLGALGGALGGTILSAIRSPLFVSLGILTTIAFLLLAGFALYKKTAPRWMRFAHQAHPGVLGLLSPLLPCAWLYGYLLAGSATLSPLRGALVLFFFWLGTLPFLIAAPTLLQKISRYLPRRMRLATTLFLIFFATLNLILHSNTPSQTHSSQGDLICSP